MMQLKGCPRCKGDATLEKDEFGKPQWHCIQCGKLYPSQESQPPPKPPTCKLCGANQVVKYGLTPLRTQRWYCKRCDSIFLNNGALYGMRYSASIIQEALALRRRRLSYESIAIILNRRHQTHMDYHTVMNWCNKSKQGALVLPAITKGG